MEIPEEKIKEVLSAMLSAITFIKKVTNKNPDLVDTSDQTLQTISKQYWTLKISSEKKDDSQAKN